MSAAASPTSVEDEPPRLDLRAAALLALGSLALYGATLQIGLYGADAASVIGMVTGIQPDSNPHVLYTKLGQFLLAVFASADPVSVLRGVSVAAGALAIGLSFLVCRGFGASRPRAVLAAGALALSPAAWFYATTV
jgi:hypothetical protein